MEVGNDGGDVVAQDALVHVSVLDVKTLGDWCAGGIFEDV